MGKRFSKRETSFSSRFTTEQHRIEKIDLFINEETGKPIYTFGFKYLSIVCDGFVNPHNLDPCGDSNTTGIYNPTLYIDLYPTGGERRIYIENEEILNIDLKNTNRLLFYNKLGALGTASVEGGFYFLYIILHNDKFITRTGRGTKTIIKFNDYNEITASTSVTYWFGTRRQNASYILGSPYIPKGFNNVYIRWVALAGMGTITGSLTRYFDGNFNYGKTTTLTDSTDYFLNLFDNHFKITFTCDIAGNKLMALVCRTTPYSIKP